MNVVEMCNVYKYFGDFCANEDVHFSLKKGEVHAILGENGAGKSTLMNILYGLYSCDQGEIFIDGNLVKMSEPSVAIQNGIGMIHQHFMLVPQLTVTQNIFLGMKSTGFWLKSKELRSRVVNLNERFSFNVDPDAVIWQLPVGVQQKVEILKVLMRDARILILDEPTAVLTPDEVVEFFDSINALKAAGYSIILITHKMREVLRYADRVTVMRQGRVVDTLNVDETNQDELALLMVGRSVSLARQIEDGQGSDEAPLLKIADLVVKDSKGMEAVKGISLSVSPGEILGIAGVDGNGQLELGEAITGLRKAEGGQIWFAGELVTNKKIRRLLDKGMAHIPDDRQRKGLVMQFTVKENLMLGFQRNREFTKFCLTDEDAVIKYVDAAVAEFDVRPQDTEYIAGSLSGGNQQKVILAREVNRNPDIIIAIQPTRGLDIGATEFVRKRLAEERRKKKAILLISTDLDEIISLSDRILVMFNGSFTGEVSHDTSLHKISLLMAGVTNNVAVGIERQVNDEN